MQTLLEPRKREFMTRLSANMPELERAGYRSNYRRSFYNVGSFHPSYAVKYNRNRNIMNKKNVENMFLHARQTGTGKLGTFPMETSQRLYYEKLRRENAQKKIKAVNQAAKNKLAMSRLIKSVSNMPELNKIPINLKRKILNKINTRLYNIMEKM